MRRASPGTPHRGAFYMRPPNVPSTHGQPPQNLPERSRLWTATSAAAGKNPQTAPTPNSPAAVWAAAWALKKGTPRAPRHRLKRPHLLPTRPRGSALRRRSIPRRQATAPARQGARAASHRRRSYGQSAAAVCWGRSACWPCWPWVRLCRSTFCSRSRSSG